MSAPAEELKNNIKSLADIPRKYYCPITEDVMEDPVVASDGYTYERGAIELWLQKYNTSPSTNQLLLFRELKSDTVLKNTIQAFKAKFPQDFQKNQICADFELAVINHNAECSPGSKAIKALLPLALKGDVYTQARLAALYYTEWPHDYIEARKWWEQAANQGLVEAQVQLGFLYFNGLGVFQSYDKAGEYWQKAADRGSAAAQRSLGALHFYGLGRPKDYVKAGEWYEKAARQEHLEANVALGNMPKPPSTIAKP